MTQLSTQSDHPYLDIHNPQHFINLVPQKLRDLILEIPHNFFTYSEPKLIQEFFNGEADESDIILRLNFWEEYNRCFLSLRQMKTEKICDGSMSPTNFYRYFSSHPGRLAFMITEPARTQNRLKYAFHLSVQNMIALIKKAEMINQKTGLPDSKLMSLKIDLFKYLDQRLHGSIIQKIEQKNLNVNVETTPGEIANLSIPADIDDKLKTIEAELANYNIQPPQLNPGVAIMDQIMEESGRVTEGFKSPR